jgi:RNA polymerase sigma-70 factor, ECF subfamily
LPDFDASDESLMQAVCNGDIDAFEQIVRRHQTWVWKIAWRFLNDREEAKDITQETFLRLLDASDRYKPAAKLTTYLYQIICRLCLDRSCKKQPSYMAEIPDSIDPNPGAAEQIEQQEVSDSINRALCSLSPDYRMVIILRYFEGLSGAEIATAINKSPKAVERLLARAREKLQPLLIKYHEK